MYYYQEIRGYANSQTLIDYAVYGSIVTYPCIALLSDIWNRKKVLVITFFFMLIASIFLALDYPVLATIFFALAPLTSVGQASYCDVHIGHDRDPNIINTFIPQPLPWLVFYKLAVNASLFSSITFVLGAVTFGSLFFFSDFRDKDTNKSEFGVTKALKRYGLLVCATVFCAFWLMETGWSSAFFTLEGIKENPVNLRYSSFALGFMYLVGVVTARLVIRAKSYISIRISDADTEGQINDKFFVGLIVTLLGVMSIMAVHSFCSSIWFNKGSNAILDLITLVSAIGGFLIPVVYAFFGSRLSYHSLGFVYAILEVTQSFSESTGVKMIESFKFLSKTNYLLIFINVCILGSFFISLLLTRKRKNAN